MKNIKRIKFIMLFGAMALASIIIFYACKPEVGSGLGTPGKADFSIVNKDVNNIILVNKSSTASIPYWTVVESGANYTGDSAKVYFGFAGTYHVKETIVSHGGIDTLTKAVTIASNDPNLCAAGTMQGFLSGCTQTKWRLLQAANALGCGPSEGDVSWWGNAASDVTTARPCTFNDEFTFILGLGNNFKYDDKGDYYTEDYEGPANWSCAADNTLSGAQVAWGTNTTSFSYQLLSGDASHPLGYLKLSGTGAHIALPKVQNQGQITSGPAASSITYNIIDTATVGGYKQMKLSIYSNDGVWWRMIISTN
jgi:hypothetical protein